MSTTPLILIQNVPRRIIEMTEGKKEEKMEIFLPEKKTMSLSRVYFYLIYSTSFLFVFWFRMFITVGRAFLKYLITHHVTRLGIAYSLICWVCCWAIYALCLV